MIDIGPNSNRLLYSLPIQATASRGMFSTRTGRQAHMIELTRVGLTCRAFARAGSKGGSHDWAHTGGGLRRRAFVLCLWWTYCENLKFS